MLKIRSELVAGVRAAESAEDLYEYLQGAVELEHATIPLYLTAAFSIKPGFNREARAIIMSVANQEMLHMSIAANVLNAIGGRPEMDQPGFIPLFPGPLPMHIHEGLTASLQKVTRGLVYNLFMAIEEPEVPIKLRVKQMTMLPTPQFAAAPPAQSYATIGDFYDAIKERIHAFGDKIFKNPSSPQVVDNTWFPPDQMFPVTDAKSACRAIDVIVEQGEGTRTSPLEGRTASRRTTIGWRRSCTAACWSRTPTPRKAIRIRAHRCRSIRPACGISTPTPRWWTTTPPAAPAIWCSGSTIPTRRCCARCIRPSTASPTI
jgi:rubrerythrin